MTDAAAAGNAAKNRATMAEFSSEGMDEGSMAEALSTKRKELAKFKKSIENKEKHNAKIKKMREETEGKAKQIEEENVEKVRKLSLLRLGQVPEEADQDDQVAYETFAVLDVDASGRISLRELQKYLAGDADYFSDVVFQDRDVGIEFESPSANSIRVKKVENLSPASDNPDVAVGLQLISFNGKTFSVEHLPKYKEWDAERRKKETEKWLNHLIASCPSGTPYSYRFQEPKMLFNPYNNRVDLDVERVGVKTVVIPVGAYNTYEEVIQVLQLGMKKASPKLGKAKVSFDRDNLKFSFDSGGPDFRLLWKTGPSKNEKAGPSLGFFNEDTDFDDEHTGMPMSLDLNMMLTADQTHIFTVELAKEFNESFNGSLEFDEFAAMYNLYLKDEKKRQVLVDRVVERFLSVGMKEERRILLEEKAKVKKRAKAQLKSRGKQKALARAQADKRKANMKKDEDGVFRQRTRSELGGPDFVPPAPPALLAPPPKTPSEIERGKKEEEAKAKAKVQKQKQMDKSKAKAKALSQAIKDQELAAQKTLEWQKRQNKLQLAMLGLESLVEDKAAQQFHPACTGFILKKRSEEEDCSTISPMYFGYQNMKVGGGKTTAGLKLGSNYAKYKSKKVKHAEIEKNEVSFARETPCAPITTGKVRAKYKEFGERYDNQEIISPAFFGQMTVASKPLNPELSHPAFHGYLLVKRPVVEDDAADAAASKKKGGKEGAEEEEEECIICYVGKPGCPMCWNFPAEFSFMDYAYEGPRARGVSEVKEKGGSDDGEEEEEEKPEIHTSLTTSNAIKLFRSVNQHWVTIYVKTVPCGQIVKMQVEAEWTVQDMYENFRSASTYGSARDCFLFLPTEQGVYSMENEDLPETDTTNAVTTGLVPLKRYNFSTNMSVIVLLHFQFFSEMTTCINVAGYLNQNLNLAFKPETKIISFTDSIPKNLPGSDEVQKQLINLVKLTIQQDTKMREEDFNADNAERGTKIKFKVDEIKEKLLVERKRVAAELKLGREARRDKERAGVNQAHNVMYKAKRKQDKEEAVARAEEDRLAAEKEARSLLKGGFSPQGLLGGIKRLTLAGRDRLSLVGGGLPGIGFGRKKASGAEGGAGIPRAVSLLGSAGKGGGAGGEKTAPSLITPSLSGGVASMKTGVKSVSLPQLNLGGVKQEFPEV